MCWIDRWMDGMGESKHFAGGIVSRGGLVFWLTEGKESYFLVRK